MRIILAGGTGFIGSSILRMDRCNEYLVVSRKPDLNIKNSNITWIKGSIEEYSEWKDDVKAFDPDVCIDMAWKNLPNYSYEACQENLKLQEKFLYNVLEIGVKKFVIAGTCWEYGIREGLVKETDIAKGSNNLFAHTKIMLYESMREKISDSNNIDMNWARIFFTYGPGQRESSLIPYIYRSIKERRNISLKNASIKNDYIYIDDTARAIITLAVTPNTSGIYNIGSGTTTSTADIANIISNILGHEDIINKEQIKDSAGMQADTTKIRNDTTWIIRNNIQQGIEKTLSYLKGKI